jgi:hypothetical protein
MVLLDFGEVEAEVTALPYQLVQHVIHLHQMVPKRVVAVLDVVETGNLRLKLKLILGKPR